MTNCLAASPQPMLQPTLPRLFAIAVVSVLQERAKRRAVEAQCKTLEEGVKRAIAAVDFCV